MQPATSRTPRAVGRRLTAVVALAVTVATTCDHEGGRDGDGGAADAPSREYTLRLRAEEQGDRYTYVAQDPVDLRTGDRVTFEMDNAGLLIHDLVVVGQDGSAIATAPAVAPGQSLTLTVDFVEPGVYRLRCNVDDHLTVHDMQVFVEVTDPDDAAAG